MECYDMARTINMTAAEITEKHARNLKASVPDIRRGVEAVTESPMEAAAASEDKYLAGVQRAVSQGTWKAGLLNVTLPEWKTATIEKGIGRIAAGIDAATSKQREFYGKLIPHIAAGQALVADMPTNTLEDSISKMAAFTRHMAEFKKTA